MSCSNLVDCMKSKGIYPVPLESTCYNGNKPANALDYINNNYYHSNEAPYNTLTIDFITNVSISSYEISAGKNSNWLLNWKLEFSINKIFSRV